jgi:hypothetical protein
MILILALAAAELALRIETKKLSIEGFLYLILWYSSALVGVVLLLFLVSPDLVSFERAPMRRLVGRSLADIPLLSLILIIVSLHLLSKAPRGRRSILFTTLICGILVLIASQTRWALLAAFASTAILFSSRRGERAAGRWISFCMLGLGISIAAVALLIECGIGSDKAASLLTFIIRDETSLETMSGRPAIWSVVWRDAVAAPFGLGYAAGPRLAIAQSGPELAKGGVIAERIGNAHNAYLELFGGAGYIGFGSGMILLCWMTWVTWRSRHADVPAIRGLVAVLIMEGFAGSAGALPFFQASAMTAMLIAVCTTKAVRESGRL